MVANSLFITGSWKRDLDLDQGNWRQHIGTDKRKLEQRYIYIEKGILVVLEQHADKSHAEAVCKQKSC